jgi:hypothetical protein
MGTQSTLAVPQPGEFAALLETGARPEQARSPIGYGDSCVNRQIEVY